VNFTPLACAFLAVAALALAIKEFLVVTIARNDLIRSQWEAKKAELEAEVAQTNVLLVKMQIEHCEGQNAEVEDEEEN
jgi:hypothetical protein